MAGLSPDLKNLQFLRKACHEAKTQLSMLPAPAHVIVDVINLIRQRITADVPVQPLTMLIGRIAVG